MADTKTIRASTSSHAQLKAWADEEGRSLTEELDHLVETLRRQRFYAQANQAYAKLREDEEAWAKEQRERELWASTLADS